MISILLLSRYGRLGASSRLRSYQYLPFLETLGVHVSSCPLLSDLYLRRLYADLRPRITDVLEGYYARIRQLVLRRKYDLIWVEREVFPWLPAWIENGALGWRQSPWVVDLDDAIFHRYDLHRVGVVRWLLGTKIDSVMSKANLVIVGNRYLAERARRAGAEWVEYLPTVVDLCRYPVKPEVERPIFTVGWIGTPQTVKFLGLIEGVLRTFCARHPDTQLTVIGGGRVSMPGVRVENVQWEEDREAELLGAIDVGIMPLPDGAFERGKCGYKLIQYMASQKPVIASPVGASKAIVENGKSGFWASSESEWLGHLEHLYTDANARRTLGAAGRSVVEQRFSLQVTGPRLAFLLCAAAGTVPNGPLTRAIWQDAE